MRKYQTSTSSTSFRWLVTNVSLLMLLSAGRFAGAQVVTNWAAYNDHVPSPATHANANVYNLRGIPGTPAEPVEGFLKDFVTGAATPAYIIATATGSPDYFGTMANPDVGTPAYNLFNGIVDVGNVNSGVGLRSSAGTTTTLTFSNLNPSQRYIFRGTSARGGSYLRRWTLVSLMGADSFADAHTSGVFTRDNFATGTMTNGQAAYDSGENRTDGALVGWNEIDPGADGVFSVKCEQYIDNPLPNGQTPDLAAYGYGFCAIYLVEVGTPTPAVITANPPANVTLEQNRPLTLLANAQGAPAPTFQWYKDNVAIVGANSRTFSIALAQPGDSGDYYLVAANSLNQATSTVSHVTVFADTNGPVLLSAKGDDSFQRIILTWNETIASGPVGEFGNYIIQDPSGAQVFVTAADFLGNIVVLHVPTLLTDTNYSIEVDFQTDLIGNPTVGVGNPVGDANGIATNFHTWAISVGSLLFQAYNTGGGNDVSVLTGHPTYPASPDRVEYITAANSRLVYPTDSRETYGATMTGFFVPQVTGEYTFYLSSDDASQLWLSTDQSEASKTMIVAETACCNPFSAHPSASIPLAAGQAYWLQLLYKEGTGGDYGQAAVKLTADPTNPDSLQPITGALLASASDPVGASVTITQQPLGRAFAHAPGVGLLSQDFNADDGGFAVTTPQTYDGPWVFNSGTGSWHQNGQAVEDNHPNTSFLDSPGLTVTVAGEVILSFDHRYSFEQDTVNWDGGQVRVSLNGGPFVAVPGGSFSSNSYNGAVGAGSTSDLKGQGAFVGTSPGFVLITSVANLGVFNAGDVVRIRFMAANDGNTTGPQTPNWEIDSVQLLQGAALNVTFSVGASAVNSGGTNPPRSYQWFRNDGAGFVPIAGANGASYSLSPQLSDNGVQFQAIIYIPGANATSAPATLTVGASAPRLASRRSGNNLIITWPGSFTTFTLETAPTVPSVTWNPVGGVTIVNGENTATVPIPANGNAFYRLRE